MLFVGGVALDVALDPPLDPGKHSLSQYWIAISNTKFWSALEMALDPKAALSSALDVSNRRWICTNWRWIWHWISKSALGRKSNAFPLRWSVWACMYVCMRRRGTREQLAPHLAVDQHRKM